MACMKVWLCDLCKLALCPSTGVMVSSKANKINLNLAIFHLCHADVHPRGQRRIVLQVVVFQQYCGGNASSGGVSLRLKAMKMKLMTLRQGIILRVWLTASWLDQKIWPWSELITEVILAIDQDGWGGHHGGQWKGRGGLVMRTSCTMETTPPSIIINMIVIIRRLASSQWTTSCMMETTRKQTQWRRFQVRSTTR